MLRPWQREAVAAVREAAGTGANALLVHACTGAGKSIFLAELARQSRGPVLVTTPTQALVDQLAGTLAERVGRPVGRYYQHAEEPDAPIVVCCHASLDRLLARGRRWGLWLADEAHRLSGADLPVPRSLAIGLTATPFTASDRRHLVWPRLVYSYPAARAIADGHLVPWRVVTARPGDTEDVHDWVAERIASAEGPGVVSAVTIADAEAYAERLGPSAAAISSRTPKAQRAELVERLRSGDLRCLVHVSLLAEGVDLPWLRWLALRRPISSRVRVVQEVGRVLRAAPGKTEAVLYDPHDLIRSVGLVHAAQIDEVTPDAEPEAEAAESWEIPELEGLGGLAELPRVAAVSAVEDWLGAFHARLQGLGWIRPREDFGRRWRYEPASPKQVESLAKAQRWAGRLRDERYRAAFRWLLEQSDLRSGTASDALDVLGALRSRWHAEGQRWMCPEGAIPPLGA